MRTALMNSTSWTRPLWGPNDRGGGGGSGDESEDSDSDTDDNEDDEDEDEDSDSDDEDGINDDDSDALEALFKSEDGDGDGDDDSDGDDDDAALQEQLATDMAAAIKKFAIPEDMIPEDFNPADPKQLRAVLANVQQATMRSTMAIMFKPIQASFERQNRDMMRAIKSHVAGNASENETRDMIIESIPAAAKPGRYKVVKDIYDRAFKKHKKPAAAIQATKKAMKALGIPLGESNRRSERGDREDVLLTGNDALDAFAKLPRKKPASSRDRVRDRLAR